MPTKQIMVVIAAVLILGCSEKKSRPYVHTLIIVEVYQEDVDANDGQVQREWRTTFKIDNGGRTIMDGKYGAVGDTLKMINIGAGLFGPPE